MKTPPIKLLLGAALATLFLIVLIQNADIVTLRFMVWETSMSQIVLLLFALAVGFGLGLVAATVWGRRRAAGKAA